MTVGEKIKYCREKIGITQGRLAELTGIHPVSIRKYETNKMQPQPPQLEKIAAALGVSYNALNNIDNAGMRLETVGDLMGMLMVLCNSGILQVSGERNKEGLLRKDTLSISFNPLLSDYFEFIPTKTKEKNTDTFPLNHLLLQIKNPLVFDNFLAWEKIHFLYHNSIQAAGDNPNEAEQKILQEIAERKEKIELILQKSPEMLDKSDGLAVKILPDYFNHQ